MGLSPCIAWVGHKYIGEVISPFRTVPQQKMTAQFLFFSDLTPKKANFVNNKNDRTWVYHLERSGKEVKKTKSKSARKYICVLSNASVRVLRAPNQTEEGVV